VSFDSTGICPNNEVVIRQALAGALALILPIGMAWSPYLHVHLDAHHDDHHAGHTIHAHVASHDEAPLAPHDDAAVGDADHERAMALHVFVAVSPDGQAAPALPAAPWSPVPPLNPGPRARPLVAHGHDPPAARLLPSRAPPRLPALL
jgi:hypothetical protein